MPPALTTTVPWRRRSTAVTVSGVAVGVGVVGQHVDAVDGRVLGDGGGVVDGDRGVVDRR